MFGLVNKGRDRIRFVRVGVVRVVCVSYLEILLGF